MDRRPGPRHSLKQAVALKVIDADFGPLHAGTHPIQEARILARLEHPGIIPILGQRKTARRQVRIT
jgi:hypothetical protein